MGFKVEHVKRPIFTKGGLVGVKTSPTFVYIDDNGKTELDLCREEINKLNEENNDKIKDIIELEKRNQRYSTRIVELVNEIWEFRQLNKTLKEENESILQENKTLLQHNMTLVKVMNKLL